MAGKNMGTCDTCQDKDRTLHPVPPDKWICIHCLEKRNARIQERSAS